MYNSLPHFKILGIPPRKKRGAQHTGVRWLKSRMVKFSVSERLEKD
jgi:hypothetical protein